MLIYKYWLRYIKTYCCLYSANNQQQQAIPPHNNKLLKQRRQSILISISLFQQVLFIIYLEMDPQKPNQTMNSNEATHTQISMSGWLKTVNIRSIVESIKQVPLDYSGTRLHDLEYKPVIQRQKKRYFDHKYMDSFVQMNKNNAQYFNPFQRNGPYRGNIKKYIRQLKQQFDQSPGNLCLSYNKYTPQQIMAVMQDHPSPQKITKNVKLNALYLSWTRVENIINFLAIKIYSNLKILNLGGNHIESIEQLAQVCLPCLQHIHLWSNNLTNIQSLSKCNWPNIETIDLHANKIVELSRLRFLGNPHILQLNFDANTIVNFDECIVLCSTSIQAKISLMRTNVVKFIGRPQQRRRKKAIQVQPSIMKVKYV